MVFSLSMVPITAKKMNQINSYGFGLIGLLLAYSLQVIWIYFSHSYWVHFSAEIWSLIQENYSQKYIANISFYKEQLINHDHGSCFVTKYLWKSKCISDALAAIDEPISNKDLITSVLKVLI